jgi:hypothetical protein
MRQTDGQQGQGKQRPCRARLDGPGKGPPPLYGGTGKDGEGACDQRHGFAQAIPVGLDQRLRHQGRQAQQQDKNKQQRRQRGRGEARKGADQKRQPSQDQKRAGDVGDHIVPGQCARRQLPCYGKIMERDAEAAQTGNARGKKKAAR